MVGFNFLTKFLVKFLVCPIGCLRLHLLGSLEELESFKRFDFVDTIFLN